MADLLQTVVGGKTTSNTQIATYSGDSDDSRLSELTGAEVKDDNKRLAYIKLVVPDEKAYDDFPEDMKEDKAVLQAILSELKEKYNKFILTGLGINSQEKVQVMPTFGDAFAVTFTGREPLILGITGYLVFDYSTAGKQSWYAAFMNAYECYLRGSRLAKWRAKLTLVLPDLIEYRGYMMNLNSQLASDNDQVIQMQFSFLVTGQTIFKNNVTTAAEEERKKAEAEKAAKATSAPTAVPPKTADNTVVTPSLDTNVTDTPIPLLEGAPPGQSTRVISTSLMDSLNQSKESILTGTPNATSAFGTAVDPSKVLSTSNRQMFERSMKSNIVATTTQDTNVYTQTMKALRPKVDQFLYANAGAFGGIVKQVGGVFSKLGKR